jgi:hypothetical protein
MTERRRPLHLAVALGVSAGVYAVSLAAVTSLQADQEAAMAAERAPTLDALASLRVANDRLGSRVLSAGSRYDAASNGYRRVTAGLEALDGRLDTLAASVAGIEGAAVALPARVPLPSVSRARTVTAPAVHATTSASGG